MAGIHRKNNLTIVALYDELIITTKLNRHMYKKLKQHNLSTKEEQDKLRRVLNEYLTRY